MLVIAAIVTKANWSNRLNRAFVLFLTLRAIVSINYTTMTYEPTADLGIRVAGYFFLAVPFALAYFALRFADPRAASRTSRWLPAALLVAALGVQAAYFLDHSLFWVQPAAEGLPWTYGPLFALGLLTLTGGAYVSVLLVGRATRTPAGKGRSSLILAALGLTMESMFSVFFVSSRLLTASAGYGPPLTVTQYWMVNWVTTMFALVPALAGIFLLWAVGRRQGDADLRGWARRFSLWLLAPAAAGVGTVIVAGLVDLGSFPLPAAMDGVFALVLAALVAYAMLRHQLFDLDVKVKWTISKGTVAAIFLAVFFVVANVAQNVLGQRMGLVLGGAASGMLFFALAPLQRVAERIADTALPGVKSPGDMTPEDRRQAYREAARQAWSDGAMSRDERAMLDRLRETLRLPEAEAHRIEREASARPGS